MKLLGIRSVSSWLEAFLHFCWAVAWLGVGLALVLPLFGPEGLSFAFPTSIVHGMRFETEGPGGTWQLDAVVAAVETPSDRAWIGCLVGALFLALIAFVLGELRAIFRSLRDGSPFVAANARRLRRMGWGILLFEALHVLLTVTVVGPLLQSLRPLPGTGNAGIQTTAWPNLFVLFVGFAVLVLAEVFRRGTVMHDEQTLTV